MARTECIINLPTCYMKAYWCNDEEDMPEQVSKEELEEFRDSVFCYVEDGAYAKQYIWYDEMWVLTGIINSINLIKGDVVYERSTFIDMGMA